MVTPSNNGVAYHDNVPNAYVVPHFDNKLSADGPIFMDVNARSHRARILRVFRQLEAIDTFQWLTMPLDKNPMVRARKGLYWP